MREIIFRAWDKFYPVMAEVMSINFITNKIMLFHPTTDEEWERDLSEVDLMQFTGLLDKQDKMIFEGDITDGGIIEFQTHLNWDSGGSLHSGFYFKTYNNEGELDYHSSLNNCKIIGNIYENKELCPKKP